MNQDNPEVQAFLNKQRKIDSLLVFQSGFAAGYNRAKQEERQEISRQIRDITADIKEHEDYIADLYRRGNQDAECILALQERVGILEAQDAK